MAEENQGSGEDELQFAEVESATPGQAVAVPQCAVCKRPIADAYFAAGDKMVCPECDQPESPQDDAEVRLGRGLKFPKAKGYAQYVEAA